MTPPPTTSFPVTVPKIVPPVFVTVPEVLSILPDIVPPSFVIEPLFDMLEDVVIEPDDNILPVSLFVIEPEEVKVPLLSRLPEFVIVPLEITLAFSEFDREAPFPIVIFESIVKLLLFVTEAFPVTSNSF